MWDTIRHLAWTGLCALMGYHGTARLLEKAEARWWRREVRVSEVMTVGVAECCDNRWICTGDIETYVTCNGCGARYVVMPGSAS